LESITSQGNRGCKPYFEKISARRTTPRNCAVFIVTNHSASKRFDSGLDRPTAITVEKLIDRDDAINERPIFADAQVHYGSRCSG
jgi:hypothetical protein